MEFKSPYLISECIQLTTIEFSVGKLFFFSGIQTRLTQKNIIVESISRDFLREYNFPFSTFQKLNIHEI